MGEAFVEGLFLTSSDMIKTSLVKVKVDILRHVQQSGSIWDRSTALSLVLVKPTEVTACD